MDSSQPQNPDDDHTKSISTEPTLSTVRQRLPLELECEIFACLKLPIQRKFISGLGTEIYELCAPKIRAILKRKRLRKPKQNGWKVSITGAIISSNGLSASGDTEFSQNVYAKKGFPITGKLSRTDNFPGTILYYFEVTQMLSYCTQILVGLSSRKIPAGSFVGGFPNSYAIGDGSDYCWLSGNERPFDWPDGAIKPKWNGPGDVFGCGLLLNPKNEVSIFFTGNGILMGKPIPIDSTVDSLYPTVSLYEDASVLANFGDNSAKQFKYDINNCPGMVFE